MDDQKTWTRRVKKHQMTLRRTVLATFLAGLVGLMPAGCSKDSAPVIANEAEELDLTTDFGGYKATDQAPSFGDPEIISSMGADSVAEDSIDTDSLSGNPRFALYTVAIRWGQLEGDSTNTTLTDWSGTASLVRGHLRVTRLLRFERGQDYIVRPRPSPREVSWVSKTSVHFDGLVFLIADPVVPDDQLPVQSSFTFTTPPYGTTFTLDQLVNLDTVITVDELGNQVAINAHRIRPEPCGEGLLEGVWRANNRTNKMGKFFGKWMNEDGSLAGHLRGHWGERGNGERVFFGQWIDLSGVFKGFVRGTYEPDPAQPGHGYISGSIYSRNKVEIGALNCEYVNAGDVRKGGFFTGTWKFHCSAGTSEL